MEEMLIKSSSWTELVLYTVVLLGVYLLLRLLYRISRNIGYWPWYQRKASKYMRKLLILYEPIAVIVIVAEFVTVKPLFHGIIIAVIIIASIALLRNYFSGRVLLWDGALSEGLRIVSADVEGVVGKLGRTGLRMKSSKGLQYLSYNRLFKDGYMISSGEYAGAYCHLNIHPKEGESLETTSTKLYDLLVSSPYVDDRYKPEFRLSRNMNALELRVLLRHERHEIELINLIREWGFSSSYNNI